VTLIVEGSWTDRATACAGAFDRQTAVLLLAEREVPPVYVEGESDERVLALLTLLAGMAKRHGEYWDNHRRVH